jgi:formylglycine-generating enzyme required for sulfatase activity
MITVARARLDPHLIDDRAAMGLASGCTSRVDPARLRDAMQRLTGRSVDQLIVPLREPHTEFEVRYAAGTLLGLLGDPRLRPDDPEMVDIPEAEVLVGTPVTEVGKVASAWSDVGVREEWIAKEVPQHRRRVEAFRIGVYLVTNLEYERFVRNVGNEHAPSSWRFGIYPHHLSNHPVWTVSPEDADAYAAWLSLRTGRHFRLPSEAEWEYAASGGDGRQFPWGEHFLGDHANTVESGPLVTTPVGTYPAGRSPFGLEDVAGNVEEYTSDDYQPYPGGEHMLDDLARRNGSYRVTRGGSFTRYGDLARCARRHGWYPRDLYAVGFRLAESVTIGENG